MTPPVRVLVVDDSATIRRVVGAVLRRAGHEVATAQDGENGLAEAAAFQPDIVLLDFTMPGLSNADFLGRLAATRSVELPVVLMATRGDAVPNVGNLKDVSVVDVITKPFSPEALLAVLNHSLEKHGRRRHDVRTVAMASAVSRIAGEAPDEDFPHAFEVDEVTERTRPQAIGSTRNAPATETGGPLLLPPGLALCGDLSVIALPEVLQLLKFQGQTGLLLVDAGGLRFELGLEGGAIVALCAREPDGSPALRGDLLLGGYFVAAGVVDEATLDHHLAAAGPLPIGERLVQAGVIDADALRRAVGEQTQDLMVELLRRRRGTFALAASQLPSAVLRPGWSVDVLMFEALRRIDEWGVIESEVPSFEARFALRLTPSGALDDTGLSAEEGAILRQLKSGPMAVRELVKRSPLRPFDVCRVVYRLAVLKRVRRIDDGDRSRLVSEESDRVPLLSTPPVEARGEPHKPGEVL